MTQTLTAPYGELVEAFAEAKAVIGKRSPLPALRCARIAGATMTSTDLETTATRLFGKREGEDFLLPIDALHDALRVVRGSVTPKRAAGEDVTIETTGAEVTVTGFGRTLRIDLEDEPHGDAVEFPAINQTVGTDGRATLTTEAAKALAGFAASAIGTDVTIPALTGMHLQFEPGILTAATTDRYRLAAAEVREAAISGDIAGVVPGAVVKLIGKLAGSKVRLNMGAWCGDEHSRGIEIGHERGWIVSRLLDAQFPRYRSLIPSEGMDLTGLDRKALVADVTTAKALHKRNPTPVDVDNTGVVVDGCQRVPGTSDEDFGFRAGYNAAFLLSGLKAFTSLTVDMRFTSAQKPVVLHGEVAGLDSAIYLQMPTRFA